MHNILVILIVLLTLIVIMACLGGSLVVSKNRETYVSSEEKPSDAQISELKRMLLNKAGMPKRPEPFVASYLEEEKKDEEMFVNNAQPHAHYDVQPFDKQESFPMYQQQNSVVDKKKAV